jgi:hypothetical protein
VVSSPPGSLVQRVCLYTALGLAAVAFTPSPADARFSLLDDTPPVVGYSIDGIQGNNNWYRGSTSGAFIVVHWSVSDPESAITSTSGCEPAVRINDPMTGTSLTCTATSAGGTTSVTTKTLKVDATPPATSVAPSRAPNSAGWYRSAVSVTWSGTDATSGIASCTPQLTYSGPDTTGALQSGTCSDNAGNWSSAGLTLHYDSTPPATSAAPSPAPNANGWLNSTVNVSWNGSDATSGIASCSSKSTYSGPDTPGAALSGSCTDNSGNTSTASFTVRLDTGAPATTAVPARAANAAGWYRAPVTIAGSGTDSLSGNDSCTSTTYGGPDTSGASTTVTCTDRAGNASPGSYVVRYDTTPPSVNAATARSPDQGSWFNQPVGVDWSGSDSTSGIASCSTATYSGPDNANAVVHGSCSDAAGNSTALDLGLKYDSTPPVTTPAPSPAPNAFGWLNTKPDVTWNGSDVTSGIATCTPKTTYGGQETSGTTLTGSCTDKAGNASNAGFTLRYDATPPATVATPARAPNGAGWFNAPVTIGGNGTDALSGVDSCTSTAYSGPDTAGTSRSVTCTDKAGNSSPGAVVVRYDATPPAVSSASTARAADSNGWYNHPVGVDWHGADATSGIASCSSLMYGGPDGANAETHGTCTDAAGNAAGLDFSLHYDSTPPTVAVSAARPADHDGWYSHPVSISWSGSDVTSGIDSCTAPLVYDGPDSANASSGGRCTDRAGNTASPPALSFRYDATPPSAVALPSRPPDSNGWYNHRLTVDWSGSDPVSGMSSCSSYAYGGPDAASLLPSGVCTDKAGNTSAPAGFSFRFDATPPTAIAAAPARPPDHDGWYNHPLPVGWSGSDALSGVASCTSVDYSGPAQAAALSGSCTDQAGNTSDPLAFNLDYDETPPVFASLRLAALDRTVALRWRVSGASHMRVSRSPGTGQASTSVIYDGAAAAFSDRKAENYVRYRYLVTAEDPAGNAITRAAFATPKPVLFAPRPGARVGSGSSPVFAWRPRPKTLYYNLQLWLEGRQVGTWWPSRARLALPSHWQFDRGTHRLGPGSYTWYVWPGRGARRLGRYGPLLGKSTFTAR